MDINEAILTRRTIRHFTNESVQEEDIKKILEAGIHAPSSKNSQPWHFVVDTTKKKDIIADLLIQNHSLNSTVMDPRTGLPANPSTSIDSARIIKEAPAVILIFCKSPFTGGRKEILKNPKMPYLLSFTSEVQSIAAAVQNMILTAHSLGLGVTWNSDSYFVADDIERLYDKKYDYVLGLCIGYPDKERHKAFQLKRILNYEFIE